LWAQIPDPASLRGDSAQTRKRLSEADQKFIAGKSAESLDDLQRILDESPSDLISLNGKEYRTAQWIAHKILTKLPPDILKNYQEQIEAPARKLLELAKRTRDPAPLWQLLDRYFVSRPADEGSLLLGDLLFERGEFHAAETVWRRLVPGTNADLTYPHSKVAPALVRARLILAAIFAGELDRGREELNAFQANYPTAQGTIAGKTGLLTSILAEQLKSPPHLSLSSNAGHDWPTFGGASDHSGSVGNRLPLEWVQRPKWEQAFRHASQHLYSSPFGHPVVEGGKVFVTNGRQLCGFDLLTGKALIPHTLPSPPLTPSRIPAEEKPLPDPCPTLTAAGGKLYVRTGPGVFRSGDQLGNGKTDESFLICFAIKPQLANWAQELWRVKPPPGDGKSPVFWEGAPVVAGRRLWAAYVRFESGRVVHGIACYDPADAEVEPDHCAWSMDVCDSPLSAANEKRTRQELVTVSGRNVIFCSNTGAVIALEAVTGRPVWAFRYPRSRKANSNRSSEPAPPVASGGRIFVAPTDGESLYALDSTTGELLWEHRSEESKLQILGVSSGKVIITLSSPDRGMVALNVATGSSREGGWLRTNNFAPHGYGKGFVTQERIFWPTTRGLMVMSVATGDLATFNLQNMNESRIGPFGNLIYADGVLVVVSGTHIWGYLSELKAFGPLTAVADEDVQRLHFNRLVNRAERILADGDWATARTTLLEVARSDLPSPYRAWAAARLLLLTPKVDAETKLPRDLRDLLTTELQTEWLFAPDGVPVTLGTLLKNQLGQKPPSLSALPPFPAEVELRKPDEAFQLSAEASIRRTREVPPGAVPLNWISLPPNPRRIYLTTATELQAISIATGDETRHQAIAAFSHVAETSEGFLVVGPLAVALYSSARAPDWVFRVPVTDSLPDSPGAYRIFTTGSEERPELSAFRISGPWLLARLGERHLIAFDLHNRRIAWVLGSDGNSGYAAATYPTAPRFGTEYTLSSPVLVVQLSDGRRWLIRTDTGRPVTLPGLGEQTSRVWWTSSPVSVEPNKLLVADGPGLVRMLSWLTGRVKWTYFEKNRDSSLTGEPPQILLGEDFLLIAVPRNHGVEIDRLSLKDGKSEWSEGATHLDTSRLSLADASMDAEHVYLTFGNVLAALDLKSGKTVWETELPDLRDEGTWAVRAGQHCVLVHPRVALPREPLADYWSQPKTLHILGALLTVPSQPVTGFCGRMFRTLERDPELWRLPGLAIGLYDAWVTRIVPILLLDLETGRIQNRVIIPAHGPAVTLCFANNLAVIATGERICWLK
jgi:outer membrane protein assembly factor BamB